MSVGWALTSWRSSSGVMAHLQAIVVPGDLMSVPGTLPLASR